MHFIYVQQFDKNKNGKIMLDEYGNFIKWILATHVKNGSWEKPRNLQIMEDLKVGASVKMADKKYTVLQRTTSDIKLKDQHGKETAMDMEEVLEAVKAGVLEK